MRAIGVTLVLAGIVIEAAGLTWLALAIVGTEWDYCPSGGDCIAGELMGLAVMAAAAPVALLGARIGRKS